MDDKDKDFMSAKGNEENELRSGLFVVAAINTVSIN